MGFRTVVVLSNDRANEWEADAELGKKIFRAGAEKMMNTGERFEYGQAIEQVHADQVTLAVLDGYGGRIVATSFWHRGQTHEQQELELLKQLAEKHGLKLIKKAAPRKSAAS